jgi:hypothetical protein
MDTMLKDPIDELHSKGVLTTSKTGRYEIRFVHEMYTVQLILRPRSNNGYGISRPNTGRYRGQTGIKYKMMSAFRVWE